MIDLDRVSKHFNGKRQVTALDGVTLSIPRGAMVSIIGLVGNPTPDPPTPPPPVAHLVRVIWTVDHGTQLAGKIYTLAGAVSGGDGERRSAGGVPGGGR